MQVHVIAFPSPYNQSAEVVEAHFFVVLPVPYCNRPGQSAGSWGMRILNCPVSGGWTLGIAGQELPDVADVDQRRADLSR